MDDEVKTGDILWLKLPYGSFSFPDDERDIIMIAGGTGVTPFISFLEYAIDNRIKNRIKLYYGVRSPAYLIFVSLFKDCTNNLNEFSCHIYIERDNHKCKLNNVRKGILSIETIMKDKSNNPNSIYYLSGPQKMIESFREKILKSEIKETNIIVDEWD